MLELCNVDLVFLHACLATDCEVVIFEFSYFRYQRKATYLILHILNPKYSCINTNEHFTEIKV